LNISVESIQPFYFTASAGQLYGIYHPTQTSRKHAVLLCYPFGDEYIRSHRAFHQLAMRLNRAGFPVLRFDYYGCGDSSGQDRDTSLTQWLADTGAAVDELKRRSGLSHVVLAGLRLGASIALITAQRRPDIAGLALWEPIVNGREYLDQLQETHINKLLYMRTQPITQKVAQPSELLGFAVSGAFLESINNLDLFSTEASSSAKIFIIETEESLALKHFKTHLEKSSLQVTYQQVDGPLIWGEDPDKALVPHQILEAIVSWVSEAFQ
jgi:exosortase A-associated hydrolase 2